MHIQIYKYTLVIIIKRNTTFSYLDRKQSVKNKIDESKEAMLNEDDNKQGKFALLVLYTWYFHVR